MIPGLVLVLATLGVTSCGDQTVAPIAEAPAVPIPSQPIPTPPEPKGTQLDRLALKAIGQTPVGLGVRVMLAAASASAPVVSNDDVIVRDTSIASVDDSGTLQTASLGQTWVVWPADNGVDSTLLVVGTTASPAELLQPFVPPTGPKATVDVRYPTPRGRVSSTKKTWKVDANGDLQAALNTANPGDEVVLAAGAEFVGNYVLPNKDNTGTDWVIVRGETTPVATGTRITPDLAVASPRIISPNQDPAIRTANGARRWRLVGLDVSHKQGAAYNYGIIVLGRGDEKAVELQPSDIVLDRMYIHGSTTDGNARCIAFNGRALAVIDSWVSECHAKGADAQGVCGWNGAGPFLIENNFIEASGQAVMFGGADPVIANLSPSDIIIRRNYMYKPMSWARGKWTVKATFELKHGKRVLFENNVLENHWVDAQTGFAILFQTLADNNTSWAWTTVQDVMVRNNLIKNSTSGANVLARVAYNGGKLPLNPTSRIAFVNNLFVEVGHDPVTGEEGREMQLLGDLVDVTVLNNSYTLEKGRAQHAIGLDGAAGVRTIVANNIFAASTYGVFGSNKGSGSIALNFYAPGSIFSGNVVPNQAAGSYPANNWFPQAGIQGILLGMTVGETCAATTLWGQLSGIPSTVGADCASMGTLLKDVSNEPPPQ